MGACIFLNVNVPIFLNLLFKQTFKHFPTTILVASVDGFMALVKTSKMNYLMIINS